MDRKKEKEEEKEKDGVSALQKLLVPLLLALQPQEKHCRKRTG